MADDATSPLVEHFFRHESAHLIAVLTRAFGLRRLELVEDVVQTSMLEAMNRWQRDGVPDNPAAWIHRVARNRILDAMRREEAHARALEFVGHTQDDSASLIDEWLEDDKLPDSLLRMMFVCCHPTLDRASQVALTLQVLCGFSVAEVARGLLLSTSAAKKRIQRAKAHLAERKISLDLPRDAELTERLSSVHSVLYLLFNEGYSTSHGVEPIRDEVCEEAARLCHMLCVNADLRRPETCALFALMLFHSARLDARVDDDGVVVLLEDQDRKLWRHDLISLGDGWLGHSRTDTPSRIHYEAAIAQAHCHAPTVADTDWTTITRLYDRLLMFVDSPLYTLNRAIARAWSGDVETAHADLDAIEDRRELADYTLLDCTRARFHELTGDNASAAACYDRALRRDLAEHERALVEAKRARLEG